MVVLIFKIYCHFGLNQVLACLTETVFFRQKPNPGLQYTGGAGRVFSRQFKLNGLYSRPLVCKQDSKGSVSDEFGEIRCKD